jgi:hypothetical protein
MPVTAVAGIFMGNVRQKRGGAGNDFHILGKIL